MDLKLKSCERVGRADIQTDRQTTTRRTLSQFWSLKIRRTTLLNYIVFADLLMLRL